MSIVGVPEGGGHDHLGAGGVAPGAPWPKNGRTGAPGTTPQRVGRGPCWCPASSRLSPGSFPFSFSIPAAPSVWWPWPGDFHLPFCASGAKGPTSCSSRIWGTRQKAVGAPARITISKTMRMVRNLLPTLVGWGKFGEWKPAIGMCACGVPIWRRARLKLTWKTGSCRRGETGVWDSWRDYTKGAHQVVLVQAAGLSSVAESQRPRTSSQNLWLASPIGRRCSGFLEKIQSGS